MSTKTDIYVMGDGDHVREHVERHLLGGTLEALRRFSGGLTSALASLARSAEGRLGAETIMAGGDDVLLRIPRGAYSRLALQELGAEFLATTGCTISFGVGNEVTGAYLNLRRAKAVGGGAVVADEGIP